MIIRPFFNSHGISFISKGQTWSKEALSDLWMRSHSHKQACTILPGIFLMQTTLLT